MPLKTTLVSTKPSAGRLLLLSAVLLLCFQLLLIGAEVRAQAPQDDHGNLLDNTATTLTLGVSATGNLEAAGDVDVFTFTVTGSAKDVWLYTTGETDTVGRLFDASNTDIGTAVPTAGNDDSVITSHDNFYLSANLEPGTYFVAVSGSGGTSTGAYTLESLDLSAAANLTLGTPSSGNLFSGEIEVFKFSLAGDLQDVWLYSTGTTDTVGFLFRSAGASRTPPAFRAANDDNPLSEEGNFYLGASLEPGTYYLAVTGADDEEENPATGDYTLQSKTGTDQVGEISEGPGILTPGTSLDGIIAPGGDQDVFKLDLSYNNRDGDVVIYSIGAVDTIGELLDADGDEVDYNDDTDFSDGDFNFLIAGTLEPGVYYIAVTGYVGRSGESTGPYKLHVEEVADQRDDRSGAETVAPDSSTITMGFISGPGDEDYFSFPLGSPGRARIFTTGSTDTVGDLQSSSGNSLADNDDGLLSPAGHFAFLIEETLSAGTYYVAVKGFGNATGPYRFVVETVEDQGDGASAAAELTLGEPVIASIDPGGDADLFKLELPDPATTPGAPATTEVLFYTTGRTDTKAALLESDGTTEVASDDDGGDGFNFLIRSNLGPGTHYIRVEGFSSQVAGAYALFAEPVLPVAPIGSLPGTHGIGRIATGHDQGYFRVDLTSPTAVWLYTTGAVDTYGTLYDSDFNELTSDDDLGLAGLTRSFSIRENLEAGTYYVNVSSYGTGTGGYALHVHPVEEPGSTQGSASALELGVPLPGTIDSQDEADYFRFSFGPDTHNYGSETYFLLDVISAGDSPLEGEVQDSGGGEIDVNMYTYSNGFILAENFPSGTYYLKVSAPSAPTPYTVIVLPHSRYANLAADCPAATADLTDTDPITGQRRFQDHYYACQWHLKNREPLQIGEDINVEDAWATTVDGKPVNGEGINVAVVDDGMDWRHEDLLPNVDSTRNYDYSGEGDISKPSQHHGTIVSGIIASRDNGMGVRGVAPRATIYGYNFLSSQSDFAEADSMTRNRETTAVSNNSWGPAAALGYAEFFWEAAVDRGIQEGYDGKGTFYVFAGGNGDLEGDDVNLDEFANIYSVTAVCAVNDRGKKSNFSERGAPLWVCAPGGDTRDGYRGLVSVDNSDRYRNRFHGTSASAPIVSGVAALLRQVNPDLTWRDLKLVLAASARKNDPDDAGWDDGARKYGADADSEVYSFNHSYGFGVVDAKAAVDLARDWEIVPPLQVSTEKSAASLGLSIPATGTATHSLTLNTGIDFVEFVEVTPHFQHPSFRDVEIELVSPSGETSTLLSHYETEEPILLSGSFRFGSAKHLGENPNGQWTLNVTDNVDNQVSGRLESWEITVYGHSQTPGPAKNVTATPGAEALTVAWEEPDVTRGAITSYDIRYIPTAEDETDDRNWTVEHNAWAPNGGNLEYVITGLVGRTHYDVQVRANNSTGAGPWSGTIVGTASESTLTCATGGALTNPAGSPALVADCDALLALRDTLEGGALLNWSAGLDFLEWDGVNEGRDAARVTHLILPGLGLNGQVPAKLADLDELEVLDLSNNQLAGSVPAELGILASLQELRLNENSLSGTVPTDLSSATSLEAIDMSANRLEGPIPTGLTTLANLRELKLGSNNLDGAIPPDWSGATALEVLHLSHNRLSGAIPSGLSSVALLEELHLDRNQLTGDIPAEVVALSNLRRLDLRENGLTGGVPVPGESRPGLEFLGLSFNQLSGEIPAGLDNWPGLVELDLAKNELSGTIPSSWDSFSNLEVLDLSGNGLSENLPTGLGQLSVLKRLYLNDNQFTGGIPDWQDAFDRLEDLYLSQNELTGCVPGGLRRADNHDLDDLGLTYCDVLLRGLTVEGAALDPSFDAVTQEYQAVAGPSRVTITPEGESGVSFEYLDGQGQEIADADPDEPGQQVDLGAGITAVHIVVTSADSKAQHTYQVRFSRAGWPGRPDIESGPITPGQMSLTVTWTAPAVDGGSGIVAYDLRHIESSARNKREAYWTIMEAAWQAGNGALTATIEGLVGGVEYDVQVRAFNGARYSHWSSTVKGTPTSANCSGAQAVTDPANNPGLVSDCEVLLALKASLPGSVATNWLIDVPMSSWAGVTLGGAPSRVAGLDLSDSMVRGMIPSTLGKLDGLVTLDLSGNEFSGPLPPQMARLTALTSLDLSGNGLTGAAPLWLGDLPLLESLDLSGNEFTGRVPLRLVNLANLRTLNLSDNGLTGAIPSRLGSLTNLETLDLSGNELERGIPSSFSRLAALNELDLSENQLTGGIPSLKVSETLDLSGNRLTGGIPSFEHSGGEGPDGPTILDLSDNQLSGEIPASWGSASPDTPNRVNLGGLTVLRLGANQLTGGVPSNLGNLTKLTELDLSGNDLTGVLPAWLTGLSGLVKLNLGGNRLTGEIPSELGNLGSLELLDLSGNELTGQISGKLAGDANSRPPLKQLLLSGNNLEGDIPLELGALSSLTHLDLSDNNLSGNLPDQLGGATALKALLLDGNALTGTIPAELGGLTGLEKLGLSDNGLTGAIPPQLGSLVSLEELHLQQNVLTGTIPSQMGSLASLKSLRLEENQLGGSIPTQLGGLTALEELWLGENGLTGHIPAELGSLTNLKELDLHHNGLTGTIPAHLGGLTKLQVLLLALNDLSGEPPDELGHLADLQELYLWGNRLTGDIPAWISGLAELRELYLRDNGFSGTVPIWLAELPALTHLYLADNNFIGCVPVELRPLAEETTNDIVVLNLPFCPDVPVVESVSKETGSLTIQWSTPDDPGGLIDYFEVRYIRSDASGKDNDDNWTVEQVSLHGSRHSGSLSYTITGLSDGVEYDIQVRTVTIDGDLSAWSLANVGTPGMPPPPPEVEPPPPSRPRLPWRGGGGFPPPADLPLPGISMQALDFTAFIGAGNPASLSLELWSPGEGSMNFDVSTDSPWVSIAPASGTSSGPLDRLEVGIGIDASWLLPGRHMALMQIAGTGFSGSPQVVQVNVTMFPAAFHGTLGSTYDTNGDFEISSDEARAAARDYFENKINLEQALGVVRLRSSN